MEEPIKPLGLRRKEFIDNVTHAIDTSNLPGVIILEVLEKISREVTTQLVEVDRIEEEKYYKELAEYRTELYEKKGGQNDTTT